MICEIGFTSNFLVTWTTLTALGLAAQIVLSGSVFYALYVKASYETWRYKTFPKYPEPSKVRGEILEMLKSLVAATLCPTIALFLTKRGLAGKAYCGMHPSHMEPEQAAAEGYGWGYLAVCFALIVFVSDWYESTYHFCGHKFAAMWEWHKEHHHFPNPSPWAVISDEWPDQLMRSMPLLVFPLVMPINMDLLFATFAVFFYAYGSYLHSGFELPWLSAHNPVVNTSYHHAVHHALSIKNKPMHIGFFVKLWDWLYGSVLRDKCLCAECDRAAGNRTRAQWAEVVVPDYSVLLNLAFWRSGVAPAAARAKTQ